MKRQATQYQMRPVRQGLVKPLALLYVAALFASLMILPAFPAYAQTKKASQRITLRYLDKIPYGTYVAFENLEYIFPDADVYINKKSPSGYTSFTSPHDYYTGEDGTVVQKEKTLYIIISPEFAPNTREYSSIMEFVGNGNHVFISALYWGQDFLDTMNIDLFPSWFNNDSLWVTINNPVTTDSSAFAYPGKADYAYFTEYDTTYAAILGKDDAGNVTLIKYTYQGGGSLYIHANPLAFTNFFLLHKNNNEYYNSVFSHVPPSVQQIQWDDYFRYAGERSGSSSLQVIMSHDELEFAFWIVLLIFMLIYLFESKRKQRIIPNIPPLRNASLDFVKTIGRLYYQYRDNKNLALKMIAHLMDHVRSRYNIPTSVMDDKFVATLAYKSGYDQAALNKLFYHARMIQDSPQISEEFLMEFNKMTEAFYKHQ
ncbi:MAG TPA: DUF4350 domain-containing protein [Chitinophagaceae bacterium]|nr:DUF4350 domain-containing protein [Chitinophagaceae bacterium]